MNNRTHIRNFATAVIFLLSLHFSHAQKDCREEKLGKSYMTICPDNIVTEKKKLLISTKAVPKKIENKNTYKVVHYYVSDRTAKVRTKLSWNTGNSCATSSCWTFM